MEDVIVIAIVILAVLSALVSFYLWVQTRRDEQTVIDAKKNGAYALIARSSKVAEGLRFLQLVGIAYVYLTISVEWPRLGRLLVALGVVLLILAGSFIELSYRQRIMNELEPLIEDSGKPEVQEGE